MNRAWATVREELLEMLPQTIFFFIMLHVVVLVRVLMLKGTGLSPLSTASVALSALVLGKAVFIADKLPMINKFPERPLAWNIAWKTTIYMVVAGIVHYLERLIDFAREAHGLRAGNEALLAKMVWSHFWGIQILLFVLILSYCTMHEVTRVIGKERTRRIFFGPMTTSPAPEPGPR